MGRRRRHPTQSVRLVEDGLEMGESEATDDKAHLASPQYVRLKRTTHPSSIPTILEEEDEDSNTLSSKASLRQQKARLNLRSLRPNRRIIAVDDQDENSDSF